MAIEVYVQFYLLTHTLIYLSIKIQIIYNDHLFIVYSLFIHYLFILIFIIYSINLITECVLIHFYLMIHHVQYFYHYGLCDIVMMEEYNNVIILPEQKVADDRYEEILPTFIVTVNCIIYI